MDAGTLETVVDKNGQNSYDTVGASLTVSLLDFGKIGVGGVFEAHIRSGYTTIVSFKD